MTLKPYTVDAHFRVPYTTTVLAKSAEEAEALAEKHKEQYYTKAITLSDEPNPWQPLYDGYILEITSVRPEPDRSCMRPFIPGYDD